MSKKGQKIISNESSLMDRILEVRYTDLEEERALCKQLLQVSEEKQYFYGSAFANVYLLDSNLALGEYEHCNFFLLRASELCKEHGFDDLRVMLCNCAGLYYQKSNDDQTALAYLLEGKRLAQKLGDVGLVSKFYNNIGYALAYRQDWETAKSYFQRAYEVIEEDVSEENVQSVISSLTNLAEACDNTGDAAGAREALEHCEKLCKEDVYNRVRLSCGWCAYYAMIGDAERCGEEVDRLLAANLFAVEDQLFVCDMAEGLCSKLLDIGDKRRSRQLLTIIEEMEYRGSLSLQLRVQCLKIRYQEKYEEADKEGEAYKKYYELMVRASVLEDDMLIQSLRSKIQMNQAKQDHETMQEQSRELKDASQLDGLTWLYNRRYFDKQISKTINSDDAKSIGFIMIDVDYFKQYNDFYGHFKGDDVLRTVARVLEDNADNNIYVSRYGGDEFACLCVNMEHDQIESYIQRVMEDLKSRSVAHIQNPNGDTLTLSIGYSNEKIEPGMDYKELMVLADQALYEVKAKGKNGYGGKQRKKE